MAKYEYVSTDIKTVMDNIDEYVIPENRRSIEYLWDKNILTTQTNNYEDSFSWIGIGKLSDENHKIFLDYVNKTKDNIEINSVKFTDYNAITVPVIPGKDTFEYFKPLIDLFKIQDVQKDGYMTIEEFYLYCTDCWKVIDNTEKIDIPEPQLEDYDSIEEFKLANERYMQLIARPRRIKVLDKEKITKPFEEYLDEAGYSGCFDEEEGKIFYNLRLYEGHMNYKNNGKKI